MPFATGPTPKLRRMSLRPAKPRALDVAAFAEAGQDLSGTWPLAELARLSDSTAPEARPGAEDAVRWSLRGEHRPRAGGDPIVRLHLQADTRLFLSCQRCLAPVEVLLRIDRSVRFVRDEAQAAELDTLSDEDVLAMDRRLDVQAWVEDEMLLDLPLVPRHSRCPAPLPGAEALGVGVAPPEGEAFEPLPEPEPPRVQPFAELGALAALRASLGGAAPEAEAGGAEPPRPPRRKGRGPAS